MRDANINEFVRLSTAGDYAYDENASFLLSFAFLGAMGVTTESIIVNTLTYTGSNAGETGPAFYQGLLALPTLQASTGLKSMATLAAEGDAMVPKGARSIYRTITLVAREDVLRLDARTLGKLISNVGRGAWNKEDKASPAGPGRGTGGAAIDESRCGTTWLPRGGRHVLCRMVDVLWIRS